MFGSSNRVDAQSGIKGLSFVCLNAPDTVLSKGVLGVVEVAAEAVGAGSTIAFSKGRNAPGDATGFAKLYEYFAHRVQHGRIDIFIRWCRASHPARQVEAAMNENW